MILRLASQQTGALRPPARAHLSSELVGSLADLPKIDPTTREMRFGVNNTVTKLGTLPATGHPPRTSELGDMAPSFDAENAAWKELRCGAFVLGAAVPLVLSAWPFPLSCCHGDSASASRRRATH